VGVTRRPAASEAPAFSRHHDPLRSVSNRAREFLSNPLIGREGDSLAIHELEEYFVFPVPQRSRHPLMLSASSVSARCMAG
jgi:hypothetical protein